VLRSSLSNKLKLVSGQGDYVSGQVRQGVSIFFGCPDREIRCPDSLDRKFRFSWVSGHPTNVSGHGSG
jgi:hypothetical protein